MAKASLAPIFERLSSAPAYHPMTAETFSDWSMEAGDLVSVSQEGTSYQSPVNSATMRWQGKQKVSIETDGTEKRESISSVSKKKYSRSGSGINNNQNLYWEIYSEDGMLHSMISATESQIMTQVDNYYEGLSSQIVQTASSITSQVNNYYAGLSSKIEQTASSITQTVANNYAGLNSKIEQTASSITQTVANNYSGLNSKIDQTASSITQTVANNYAGLNSKIEQTASSITQTVTNNYNGLNSKIEQTASSITQTVANNYSGLSSRITQTESNIELKVDKNGVISAINVSDESIDISSTRVNLSGYVTASQLAATNATISNLMSGNATASKIVTDDLRLPGEIWYHNHKYTEFYSNTEGKFLLGRS